MLESLQKLLEAPGRTLRDNSYRTVSSVAHPPRHAQSFCGGPNEIAESHTLHAPYDERLQLLLHKIRVDVHLYDPMLKQWY